jgi:hypothetical protein
MRLLAPDSEADLYAISCRLGLTRIGVAADARERLRAMQVGSPVELQLVGRYHYPRADDAYAVAADLRRQFAGRRKRGGWYKLSATEVRYAIGNRSARQAPRQAAEARAAADAATASLPEQERERARLRRRTRAQARRQKLRALARLLAQGSTQRAAARELGVSERTIHRWMRLPGFEAELAKARSRHQREPAPDQRREQARLHYHERHRLARQTPLLYQQLYTPSTRPQPRPEQPHPAAATEPRPRSPSQDSGGVPLFPGTSEGQQQRLAYYEAHKLDHLPDSLLDYHDVKNGRETPAERRARQQHT